MYSLFNYGRSTKRDINILLLGETGVGKSTFINGFVNYLHYDTLDQALNNEMKVLIPSRFVLEDTENYDVHEIKVGNPDKNENHNDEGASSTQSCRSYVFQIGGRQIRLIDGPGVGDTRGIEYETRNFANILAHISQFEYLNGICILLKPAQSRLNIFFRYCVKELLRHLHRSAKDNIIFVFTNARTTFYKPGETTIVLRKLLQEIRAQTGVEVPFDQSNTFMFDNEGFRFVAAFQNGIRFIMDDLKQYEESWTKSVAQVNRLIQKILSCGLHPVRETRSVNEAHQLIHQLSRPIAETSRLILENIGMAEKYKKKILEGHSVDLRNAFPQKIGRYVELKKRLTVCISPECTALIQVNGETRIDYHKHCHDGCFLQNVVQECIGHPILRGCSAMNTTGTCTKCGCRWDKHMHITYRYETETSYIEVDPRQARSTPQSIMNLIDQRILALRKEEKEIRDICVQLSGFLRANSITPFNDDLMEYLRHFLEEEKQKQAAGAGNADLIRDLEQNIGEYQKAFDLYTKTVQESDGNKSSGPDELDRIFSCIQMLYDLPINGNSIKEQIRGIRRNQIEHIEQGDQHAGLPTGRNVPKALSELTMLMNSS